jgi:hypothetical protein
MRIMQGLILGGTLGVREVAERTCAQDGSIDGEMELSETLGWWSIFLALVFVLWWFVFRERSGSRGDGASAFERLWCVVE